MIKKNAHVTFWNQFTKRKKEDMQPISVGVVLLAFNLVSYNFVGTESHSNNLRA